VLDFKAYFHRLRDHFVHLLESPTDELGRLARLAVYQIRLWRFCGRQLVEDRLMTVAGDLTFKSLLGIIPALVIFLMVVDFFARGSEIGQQVQDALFRALNITDIRMHVGTEEVRLADKVGELLGAVHQRMQHAAAAGLVILVVLAMEVLATAEAAMNRIWQVRKRRSWWRRIVLYWVMLTLGPPAAAAAVYGAQYLSETATTLPPWVAAGGGWLAGLAATWLVFFVFYKLLPNVAVRVAAAGVGAVVAGTSWHVLAKGAFGTYVKYAVGYGQIYGTLGVVPLFILWIYVTWVFVLFGCELASVVQNFSDLARAEALERERRRGTFLPADFVALAALAAVVRRFRGGEGPAPLAVLVEATGVDRDRLEELLARLEAAGLAVRTSGAADEPQAEAAFLPGREADQITVADVVHAVRSRLPMPIDARHAALHERVRAAYDRLQADRTSAAARITLADLVAG